MGETPVTQALWQAVMGSNPSHFKESGPEAPVERVSWEDVQHFLKTVNDTMSTGAFRLPTEAEWEYAARAGSRGPFALPCDYRESNKEGKVPGLDRFAWYSENSGGHTHPVGELEPNAWGLHDVHGNVEEWCQDWFGDYPTGRRTDYAGSRTGGFRVLRGGSWYSVGRIPRSARRGWCGCGPGIRISVGGFRLVWSPSAPQG
jgi:formylglycine-generating enzyme required for sulfatase activity